MDDHQLSLAIAQALARAWLHHQSPSFTVYTKETFGCVLREVVKCDAMYIAEAEEGDTAQGRIGGLVKQWWIVDDRGINPIYMPKLPMFRDAEENLRGQFYRTPVVKFFRYEDGITISEAFGPEMHCRKIGKVALLKDLVTFEEIRVLWSSKSH